LLGCRLLEEPGRAPLAAVEVSLRVLVIKLAFQFGQVENAESGNERKQERKAGTETPTLCACALHLSLIEDGAE